MKNIDINDNIYQKKLPTNEEQIEIPTFIDDVINKIPTKYLENRTLQIDFQEKSVEIDINKMILTVKPASARIRFLKINK